MIAIQVNDMTCGHCVSTITKAIRATDKDAKVTFDLARHLVVVEPVDADTAGLVEAIKEAGYSAVPVQLQAKQVDAPQATRRDCCGCCQ